MWNQGDYGGFIAKRIWIMAESHVCSAQWLLVVGRIKEEEEVNKSSSVPITFRLVQIEKYARIQVIQRCKLLPWERK